MAAGTLDLVLRPPRCGISAKGEGWADLTRGRAGTHHDEREREPHAMSSTGLVRGRASRRIAATMAASAAMPGPMT